MRKISFAIISILFFANSFGQKIYKNIEGFTHPVDIKKRLSIYSNPNIYLKELKADVETGWMVEVKQKKDNYFQIDIKDLKLYNVWIHLGDIGIVVQNYDSIAIPVYLAPNTNSIVSKYIFKSCVGLIYDVTGDFFLLQIIQDNQYTFGWIERKYLCSNPYTTCS